MVLQKLARLRLSFKKTLLLSTTFKHLHKRWKNCVLPKIFEKLTMVVQKVATLRLIFKKRLLLLATNFQQLQMILIFTEKLFLATNCQKLAMISQNLTDLKLSLTQQLISHGRSNGRRHGRRHS